MIFKKGSINLKMNRCFQQLFVEKKKCFANFKALIWPFVTKLIEYINFIFLYSNFSELRIHFKVFVQKKPHFKFFKNETLNFFTNSVEF